MSFRKRNSPRKDVHYPCWVEIGHGAPQLAATIADISVGGAKLLVPNSYNVPESFTLLLTRDGNARRRCRVVWRSPSTIGIQFVEDIRTADDAANFA
jgi:hypothetical protein